MAKTFEDEFKVMIVDLLQSGRKATELGEEYGISAGTVRRWHREYKKKSGDFSKPHVLTPEQLELKALQKELKEIRLERDILKKAVSIFSKNDR